MTELTQPPLIPPEFLWQRNLSHGRSVSAGVGECGDYFILFVNEDSEETNLILRADATAALVDVVLQASKGKITQSQAAQYLQTIEPCSEIDVKA